MTKTKRTCKNGHTYFKSSDCPVCPICENQREPEADFLAVLSAPARRAMENNDINSLVKLAKFTEAEVLAFHGIGKSVIPKLKEVLKKKGLTFKKN